MPPPLNPPILRCYRGKGDPEPVVVVRSRVILPPLAAPVAAPPFLFAAARVAFARRPAPTILPPIAQSKWSPSTRLGRFYSEHGGRYRVFAPAVYRFYRSSVAPPVEGDTPFATSATLPSTPVDTYGDAIWYLSMSYFNGVLDSGFLPLGPRGETYLKLEISSGLELENPPTAPLDVRLELRAGGVVRVIALYLELGALRADTWAIAFTTNGSTPPTDTPTVTQAVTDGLAVLSYDLPAQAHGTTVKVRVQTRRVSVYSDGSSVLTALADSVGPVAPTSAVSWAGPITSDEG